MEDIVYTGISSSLTLNLLKFLIIVGDSFPFDYAHESVVYEKNMHTFALLTSHKCIFLFMFQSEHKWKQLAELAISKCQFQLAQECLINAQDFGGLLLLATSAGDADMILRLAETSAKKGKNNVAFLAYFLLGR